MALILADTPIIECVVRRQMFYDQDETKEGFVPGYILGFCGRPGQAPAFQVMTEEGAMWARVPLHMLAAAPCDPLPLETLAWWDCFSDEFTVHAFDFLRGYACTAIDRDGTKRPGNYLFTVDWSGRWAEIPDQHKQHHFIRLDSGHFAMYPNNKLLWHDESWIVGMKGKPDWSVNRHAWAIEGSRRGTLADPTQYAYEQGAGSTGNFADKP